MPEEGTKEYELLLKEVGDPRGGLQGFDQEVYENHIAATRRPEEYPGWLDPIQDRDARWGYESDPIPKPQPLPITEPEPQPLPITEPEPLPLPIPCLLYTSPSPRD